MIKTTVVGSYPVPAWLSVFSNRDSLRDAMMAVIKTQELAGIDVVADGELYRWDINHGETNGMIDYFLRPMSGLRTTLEYEQLKQWREREDMAFRSEPAGIVLGPIGAGTLNLKGDYDLYRGLTDKPKKFTVTSPYMLAKGLADEHYTSLEDRVMAIAQVLAAQAAEIDADVIQIDEAYITGNPQDGPLAAEGINTILRQVRGEKGVHLCYGNYGGQTIQSGTYKALLDFLNRLETDHLILEMARRPENEIHFLQDINESVGLGIGVIDIKDNLIETPEIVCARIEKAAQALGKERIHYVHPDCGFWMLPRSVADGKMAALVAGRNLFEGR